MNKAIELEKELALLQKALDEASSVWLNQCIIYEAAMTDYFKVFDAFKDCSNAWAKAKLLQGDAFNIKQLSDEEFDIAKKDFLDWFMSSLKGLNG